MPRTRDRADIGTFPLQDHREDVDHPRRQALAGVRITDDEIGVGFIEGEEDGRTTWGDIHPWRFWQGNGRREYGSWSSAFPAIVTGWGGGKKADGGGGAVTPGGTPGSPVTPRGVQPTTGGEQVPSNSVAPGPSAGGGESVPAQVPSTTAAPAEEAAGYFATTRPIRKTDHFADPRYNPKQENLPDYYSLYPVGYRVVALAGTEEGAQHDIAMSGDDRIIAPHKSGPNAMGTYITDLDPTGRIPEISGEEYGKMGWSAPIQTALRVMRHRAYPKLFNERTNVACLNYTLTGQGDMMGHGAFVAKPQASASGGDGQGVEFWGGVSSNRAGKTIRTKAGIVTGLMGYEAAGPITPGNNSNDKHEHGRDLDDNSCNAAHLSTDVYFYRNRSEDAPLEFSLEQYPNPEPSTYPFTSQAFISYDKNRDHKFLDSFREGLWRVWSMVPYYGGGDKPGKREPTDPPTTPPPEPREPSDPVPPDRPGGPVTPRPPGPGPGTPDPGGPGGPGDPGEGPGEDPGGGFGVPDLRDFLDPVPDLGGPTTGGGNPFRNPNGAPAPTPAEPQDPTPPPYAPTTPTTGGGPAIPGSGPFAPDPGAALDPETGLAPGFVNPTFPFPDLPGATTDREGHLRRNKGGGSGAGNVPKQDGGAAGSSGTNKGTTSSVGIGRSFVPEGSLGLPQGVGAQLVAPDDVSKPSTDAHAMFSGFVGFASMLWRPQSTYPGTTDFRKGGDASVLDRVIPTVARVEAWGAEVDGEWVRSEDPNRSRGAGGTAAGGINVSPPETDVMDQDTDMVPEGGSTSETYFNVSPGAYYSAGVPDSATGSLKDCGMRWGNQDGNLKFEGKTGGAWSEVMNVSKTTVSMAGIALQSPNGNWHKVAVDDAGNLTTEDVGSTQP